MPIGVKIIAILSYIMAALLVLSALGMIFWGAALAAVPAFALFAGGFIVIAVIILLAFAALYFFVGRGLWIGQNWARIVMIILSILGLIGAISNIGVMMARSIAMIVINAIIILYLGCFRCIF